MSAELTDSPGEHPEGCFNGWKQQVRMNVGLGQKSEEETAQARHQNVPLVIHQKGLFVKEKLSFFGLGCHKFFVDKLASLQQ